MQEPVGQLPAKPSRNQRRTWKSGGPPCGVPSFHTVRTVRTALVSITADLAWFVTSSGTVTC